MTQEIDPNSNDPAEPVELYVKDSDGNYVQVEISEPDGEDAYLIAAQQSSHIGPLPSVEQFRAYGEVVSDAPERILRMAEKDQQAYHAFMSNQLSGRLSAISQGQWMGFVAMMVALVGAIYLALKGQTAVAIALASPGVIVPIMRFYFAGKQPSTSETSQPD